MGKEGETPAQFFWHIGVKKVVKVVQIWGSGGRGNLDKIQKNSYFFRETVPKKISGHTQECLYITYMWIIFDGIKNSYFLKMPLWAYPSESSLDGVLFVKIFSANVILI